MKHTALRRTLAALLLIAACCLPAEASTSHRKRTTTSTRKAPVPRSRSAKADFLRQSGYPHGRPGYVVDHIIPLACGGADAPYNMQWQSIDDAKAKDKVERKGCSR